MDNLHEKVLNALKNCVDEPKCRDCPWEECEGPHAHVQLPRGLVEAVIGLLKAQDVSDTNVGRWVSVKERMPDNEDKIYLGIVTGEADRGDAIVHFDKSIEFVRWDRESGFYLSDYWDDKIFVSKWMEIPF